MLLYLLNILMFILLILFLVSKPNKNLSLYLPYVFPLPYGIEFFLGCNIWVLLKCNNFCLNFASIFPRFRLNFAQIQPNLPKLTNVAPIFARDYGCIPYISRS